jgi:hypothetical protein
LLAFWYCHPTDLGEKRLENERVDFTKCRVKRTSPEVSPSWGFAIAFGPSKGLLASEDGPR